MSIQDWGAIGELIGAVATVITLIYLAHGWLRSTESATSGRWVMDVSWTTRSNGVNP